MITGKNFLSVLILFAILAAFKYRIVGDYKHPAWMNIAGWLVVIAMVWLGIKTILLDLPHLW